jgi:hypothetical protein
MTEQGVRKHDHVQAVSVEVYGMDAPVTVWVVVAPSGLVISVAEPPIGHVLPGGPYPVDLVPQAAQGPH